MTKSIERVFTFFIVIILFLILVNLFGPFIASSIQPASEQVGNILRSTWTGVKHLVPPDSGGYGTTG
jgi:dolichol kinase